MQKLSAQTLDWPTDWPELFGRQGPLILEIGFGRGVFIAHLADLFPNANIVGLEISNRCMVAGERIIERKQLANVRLIHSMAETALHHLFVPASLAQVHINFPDPWFKSRHAGRRLMQRDTLDAIVSRMQPNAPLLLATDIVEYAEMSAELLAATPGLSNLLPTPWTYDASLLPIPRVVTKYESTAQREGRPSHFFAYQRNHQPAPPVPVIEEFPMPHIVFRTPLPLESIRQQFQPSEVIDGETIIRLLSCYLGDRALLFDVYVKEPTIEQRIAVMLHPRDNGDLTLMLGALGHPRVTAGIHRAVGLLGEWLFSLHPDTQRLKVKIQAVDED